MKKVLFAAIMLIACTALQAQDFGEQADSTTVVMTPRENNNPVYSYNLSEFRRLADGEEGKLVMYADTVYFVMGNDVFLRSDGSMLLRNTGLAFESRQIVAGTVYGRKLTVDGMIVLEATESDPRNSFEVREYADPEMFECALRISHSDDSELAKQLIDSYLNNLVSLDNVEVTDEATNADSTLRYQARVASMGNLPTTLTDPYGYCMGEQLVGKVFNSVTGYLTLDADNNYQLCLLSDITGGAANGIGDAPRLMNNEIMNNEARAVVYDLQGRQVNYNNRETITNKRFKLKLGVYILNGKKIVKK